MSTPHRIADRKSSPPQHRSNIDMSVKPAPLTVAEFCTELRIARSTFYEWRAKGIGPRCIKLPNGALRIRRTEANRWIDALGEAA